MTDRFYNFISSAAGIRLLGIIVTFPFVLTFGKTILAYWFYIGFAMAHYFSGYWYSRRRLENYRNHPTGGWMIKILVTVALLLGLLNPTVGIKFFALHFILAEGFILSKHSDPKFKIFGVSEDIFHWLFPILVTLFLYENVLHREIQFLLGLSFFFYLFGSLSILCIKPLDLSFLNRFASNVVLIFASSFFIYFGKSYRSDYIVFFHSAAFLVLPFRDKSRRSIDFVATFYAQILGITLLIFAGYYWAYVIYHLPYRIPVEFRNLFSWVDPRFEIINFIGFAHIVATFFVSDLNPQFLISWSQKWQSHTATPELRH